MENPEEMKPLLTAPEVARYFRVDPHTVRRWVAESPSMRERLGAIRTPGGHWRFDPEAVEAARERLTNI